MGRFKIRAGWYPRRVKSSLYGSSECRIAISRMGCPGHVSEQCPEVGEEQSPHAGLREAANLCAAFPAPELRLGSISDAVAASIDSLQLQRAHVTAIFCWQPHFWTADKKTVTCDLNVIHSG